MSAGGNGAGAVVRQGQLRKLKTMKKKYFVLRAETVDCSARLEYYESEKKFRGGASPRRVLPLKSCYNIMRRLDLKQKHVIALFTREEQFCVVADNEQDLHAWLSAILKEHRSDDASQELLHPIQHVWQVNVQKKGLGASKNIQGLYNLCLTDKTLALVKIKSQNNVISDLGIPERVEYSLKNIRRCGDSECFFYMEVGRQTVTGAGELWMLSDDSNIAQSMHSTIHHAMRNCAKETENERDHIVLPKYTENTMSARRQTYSDGQGKAGLANAENQPPNNPLTDKPAESNTRVIKHHRTVSLPTGCPLFQEPLKIVHERSWSSPLTGDEVDRALVEKAVMHSSCKAINGNDSGGKKTQWSRRASTGTRWSKLSPAHTKNTNTLRNRCDSMPSRPCLSFEVERPPPRHNDFDVAGIEVPRDETDALTDWTRTPRIPEEPDCCDIAKDLMKYDPSPSAYATSIRGGSVQHSRTSSFGVDDDGGYLPMTPAHDALSGLISASSGSVCSGTPSTDPRFSEYQLEPATSHIGMEWRPPRAYSVGSRPATTRAQGAGAGADAGAGRHRAYSVGARRRPTPQPAPGARHAPRASADDLMELDFSNNSPANKASISRTPPSTSFTDRPKMNVDEYVDMSRNAGYVEMHPGKSRSHPLPLSIPLPRTPPSTPAPVATTPDGYVKMDYGRAATKPIAINAVKANPQIASSPPHTASSPEDARRRRLKDIRTPHGSQTIFPLSLDSPASPPDGETDDLEEDAPHHPLSTVREISEEGGRRSPELPVLKRSPEASSSPQYVKLVKPGAKAASSKTPEPREELSCNPTATKTIARIVDPIDCRADSSATLVLAGVGQPARFSLGEEKRSPPPASPSPSACAAPLNYAALDLEPRRAAAAAATRTYTQIDFVRSEKLHAADGT